MFGESVVTVSMFGESVVTGGTTSSMLVSLKN